MKKLTSFMVAAVFLGANMTAMAATPKPPKELCVVLGGFIDVLILGTKAQSTIKLSSSKQKFYNIVGEWDAPGAYSVPSSGSGHMNGDVFHASTTGTADVFSDVRLYGAEIFWDVVSATGTANLTINGGYSGEIEYLNLPLTQVPCSSADVTYGPDSGPAMVNP
jgi:hypothetical protein